MITQTQLSGEEMLALPNLQGGEKALIGIGRSAPIISQYVIGTPLVPLLYKENVQMNATTKFTQLLSVATSRN